MFAVARVNSCAGYWSGTRPTGIVLATVASEVVQTGRAEAKGNYACQSLPASLHPGPMAYPGACSAYSLLPP
jgi:hypothetical protein